MTREETKEIIGLIKLQYTNYNADVKILSSLIELWSMVLCDYTYEQVKQGLALFIRQDTKGFAPVPGQIIEQLVFLNQQKDPRANEQEAWEIVYKAICRANYYSQEDFEKFTPEIQRAVGGASNLRQWAMMDLEMMSATEAQFKRAYLTEIKRKDNISKLPTLTQEKLLEIENMRSQTYLNDTNNLQLEKKVEASVSEQSKQIAKSDNKLEEFKKTLEE